MFTEATTIEQIILDAVTRRAGARVSETPAGDVDWLSRRMPVGPSASYY